MRPYQRLVLMSLCTILLSGCAASGHQQFYREYPGAEQLQDVERLPADGAPRIFSSSDMGRDVRIAKSKGFVPIGYSSFNGQLEGEDDVVRQAKRVGALLVLVTSEYTNTETTTVPLFIPNSSTTSTYGTVNSGSSYGSYSGTSVTRGTSVVPMTSNQRRFDQGSVYFVRSSKRPRFGIWPLDLTPEMRSQIGRNTGVLVDVVIEDSRAFNANILPDDVLIEFDGIAVKNADHFMDLLDHSPSIASEAPFDVVILRRGQAITLKIAR